MGDLKGHFQVKRTKQEIEIARGKEKGEVLLKNASLVNVLSCEVYTTNILINQGKILGIGREYQKAKKVYDLKEDYLLPGLIDGHLHLESSLLTAAEYARAVLPRGTTTVIADPHEIANVLGIKGIEYLLSATKNLPLDFFFMAPSAVPATTLESSGATLRAKDLKRLLKEERVLGLGELMNYPGALKGEPELLKKIKASKELGKLIDGHAPGLSGMDLNAYVGVGAGSDHECISVNEAKEKLRLGMRVMIREGSVAKNLLDLLPLVNQFNSRRFMLVSDDTHPQDLLKWGHLGHLIGKAFYSGFNPVLAVQMTSINVAEYFGLKGIGAIAPGYQADLVVIEDFDRFKVKMVFKKGRLVVREGKILVDLPPYRDDSVLNTINISSLSLESFKTKVYPGKVKVIELVPGQIFTKKLEIEVKSKDGYILSDPEQDILKLAVIERHKASGNIGLGLVKGLGLQKGALASSVAHDSHNLIVAGVSEKAMLLAAKEVAKLGGGLVVASEEKILASLPLPIAGLISSLSLKETAEQLEKVNQAASDLGSDLRNPFVALSFLALPVIPKLKLTDKGLVEVDQFQVVPLGERPA